MRCSIAWCPWKAKYFFTGGYQECWFHYTQWIQIIWDLLTWPCRWLYIFIRYKDALMPLPLYYFNELLKNPQPWDKRLEEKLEEMLKKNDKKQG